MSKTCRQWLSRARGQKSVGRAGSTSWTGWQWWFPGLWFVALAVVGVTGARTRALSGPRTPAAGDPRRR